MKSYSRELFHCKYPQVKNSSEIALDPSRRQKYLYVFLDKCQVRSLLFLKSLLI